jgi:hypothetical protein
MRPTTQKFVQIVGTSLAIATLTNALSAPTASPIVYAQRPPLMQVDAKAVARELLTDKQFRCLTRLIGKESAWNPKAKNPSSTAIGIGQLLEGTYQNLGMKHSKAEVPQMVAALAYIGRKYGSAGPCGAWRHWQKKNWY